MPNLKCKKTVIFQAIQFSLSTHFSSIWLIEPFKVLPLKATVDRWAMKMKGYSALHRTLVLLETHHQIFNIISRTLVVRCFVLLQRCSRCILRPQLTRQSANWYIYKIFNAHPPFFFKYIVCLYHLFDVRPSASSIFLSASLFFCVLLFSILRIVPSILLGELPRCLFLWMIFRLQSLVSICFLVNLRYSCYFSFISTCLMASNSSIPKCL